MKWDKVEVKTEQIIDENPHTWIDSASEDFNAGNYDSALEKLQQARVFANNDPAILTFIYGQEIFVYVAQNNKTAARESSRLLREYGNLAKLPSGASAFDLVIENPILSHICMDVNPYDDFWYQNWLTSVDRLLEKEDFDLISDMLVSDEMYKFTEKTLAEHATNDFVFAVVQHSKLNLLQALHRGGFNLSACRNLGERNLLMTAVIENSSPEILKFLINNKINDIDAKDNDGWTALMHCVNSRTFRIKNLELLINAGAYLNTINKRGQTALIIAVQSNNAADKIRLLLESGANVSYKDTQGREAIFYVRDEGSLNLLINAGANVNATDGYSLTVLMLAAEKNDISKIRLLLESGANVSLRDSDGCDAIYYTNDAECLRLLLRHGADVNQHYSYADGKTLLHMVAKDNHWQRSSYWEALLSLGADVNAKDNYSHTPLEYALDHSWTFTAELDLPRALVRKGAIVTYEAEQIMRHRKIKRANLYNNSTNFFFSSWFK